MKLKNFVKRYIEPNTIIRLWVVAFCGHKMIIDENKDGILMEWKLKDSKYAEREVLGVTDIYCDSYPEAVNIVLE